MEIKSVDFKIIAIVSSISIICVIVFLLPLEIQDMLKVRHSIFNPLTYITASFVHGDLQHLGFNLFFFILFAFLLFFLTNKVKKQQFFFYSLLIMIVVLPLLNYGLLFYFGIWKSIESGYGLSLIDSSLIGFTVPSFILFFKSRLKKFNSILFFASMFLLTACFIIVPYVTFSSFNLVIVILCATLGFVFGILEVKRIMRFIIESFKQREKKIESLMVVFALWFYFFSIVGLFPTNVVSQEGVIDIVSHYVGFLFGILPFSVYSILIN